MTHVAHPPCHVDHQSKTNKMINLCLITQSPITSHHTPQSPPRFPIILHRLIISRVNRSNPRKVFTPPSPQKLFSKPFFLSFLNNNNSSSSSFFKFQPLPNDPFNPQLQTTLSCINTHTLFYSLLYIKLKL